MILLSHFEKILASTWLKFRRQKGSRTSLEDHVQSSITESLSSYHNSYFLTLVVIQNISVTAETIACGCVPSAKRLPNHIIIRKHD